ncbi:MAG TPA: anthranilate synthase component I family protein [Thermoanaerobaculia bacterium]|nr:anthranilate synthase component I family protein [Thermoanaerobaculia bacterium]
MFANHTYAAPRETRTLAWAEAAGWKAFVRELESDAGDGRWVGFIAYEALASEEDVMPRDAHPCEPAAFFSWHERPASPHAMQARARTHRAVIRDSLGGGAHRKLVERIRQCIRDGDVYQVNLTRAFEADVRVDAGELYAALTAPHAPQCSALIHGDGWAVVSASPEVMLRFDRRSGVATSMPIKGTVRREGDDAAEIRSLLGSAKDEAEHLMIVDVVRNDFGKVAPPGRVSVSEYRAVRTLDYVHHLESTVRAEGLKDASVADVLGALAPAASITGAPKRAAVQLIRELEPVPRGVYCGSIGTIDAHGAEMSVAIRTAVVTGTTVRYHAGGGIVWDSDPAAEDDECRAKAAPFFRFLGGAPSTSA